MNSSDGVAILGDLSPIGLLFEAAGVQDIGLLCACSWRILDQKSFPVTPSMGVMHAATRSVHHTSIVIAIRIIQRQPPQQPQHCYQRDGGCAGVRRNIKCRSARKPQTRDVLHTTDGGSVTTITDTCA